MDEAYYGLFFEPGDELTFTLTVSSTGGGSLWLTRDVTLTPEEFQSKRGSSAVSG